MGAEHGEPYDPDFDGRPAGWSSKVCFDLREASTDLYCFVPAENVEEKEQEGGEGVVIVSPSRSLAPMYVDWLGDEIEPGWEVHGNAPSLVLSHTPMSVVHCPCVLLFCASSPPVTPS